MSNLAFLNAVAANGGVVTDVLREKYGAKEQVSDTKSEPDLSREGIAEMKRSDVIEHLVAHGMDKADAKGVELPDLREKLIAVVFVGD